MYKWYGLIFRSRCMTALLSLLMIVGSLGFYVDFRYRGLVDQELGRLRAARIPIDRSQFAPAPVPLRDNAAPFYEAAWSLLSGLDRPSRASSVEAALNEDQKTTAFILKERGAVFTLLAEAYRHPVCRYKYYPQEGIRTRYPNFLAIRTMAVISAVKTLLDVRTGNISDALQTSAHMLRFESTFDYGGTLIAEMIMVACSNLTLEPLEKLADRGVGADFSEVLRELSALRQARAAGVVHAVDGERSLFVDFFERTVTEGSSDLEVTKSVWWWRGPLVRVDEYTYLRLIGEARDVIAAAHLESPSDLWSGVSTERVESRLAALASIPSYAPLTKYALPNLSRVYRREAELLMRIDRLVARLQKLSTALSND